MTPLWLAIALMVLGFTVVVALVLIAAAIAQWWESWQERRYEQSPEEAAWEAHCATTPGLADFEAWEDGFGLRPVYDVDDFPGGAA